MLYRKAAFVCCLSLIALFCVITAFASFAEDSEVASSVESGNSVGSKYITLIPPVIVTDDEFEDDYDIGVDESDPLESFNRIVYKFNDVIDSYLLVPVVRGYRKVIPEYGRDRISNVLNNITSPVSFVNNILQGDIRGTATVFWRFVINSTIGIGGLHDIAADFGLERDDADFGQTMGVYGLESGPYIVLPFLGSTTLRDGLGDIVDIIYDPTTYTGTKFIVTYRTAEIVDDRESILDFTDDIEKDSFDPYTSIKSSYLQNRQKKIDSAYNYK